MTGLPPSPLPAEPAHAGWALTALLRKRRLIAGSALLAAFAVGVFVLVRPRLYTVTASILPVSRRASLGGNVLGLAASFGLNLAGADNQSPAFFADLVRTPTILLPAVTAPLDSTADSAGTRTLKDYYGIAAASEALRADAAVRRVRSDIHVSLMPRTGVIRIAVTMRDPAVATAAATRVLDALFSYNVASRQEQAAAERRFTETRVAEARGELLDTEDRLRRFLRSNRQLIAGGLQDPDLTFERDRLEREVNLRQQVYTTLSEAHEQARIEALRDTPLLTMVEPPRLPLRPDGRGVVLKVLLALFVAGAVAVLGVLAAAALAGLGGRRITADPEDLARALAAAREDLRHPLRAVAETLRPRRSRPDG